ncbi:hypothetical protein BVRB_7g166730 [Beta vulgaris subsp. vulgaris]|nr:hypothetical protein BVRB_7g166730 [Beta vulgaris subsp. vulgaris]
MRGSRLVLHQNQSLVPQGHRYLVNVTRFEGPCTTRSVFQVSW